MEHFFSTKLQHFFTLSYRNKIHFFIFQFSTLRFSVSTLVLISIYMCKVLSRVVSKPTSAF